MDLCAAQLLAHLPAGVVGADECPPFRRTASRLTARPAAYKIDRLLNRFVTYPKHARRLTGEFDLFHIVDHSYAQLVSAVPAGRAGVYVHDLDTFRCLLDSAADPRPGWFRAFARRTLTGLRAARVVFHSTLPVRDEIESLRISRYVNPGNTPSLAAPGPHSANIRLCRPATFFITSV